MILAVGPVQQWGLTVGGEGRRAWRVPGLWSSWWACWQAVEHLLAGCVATVQRLRCRRRCPRPRPGLDPNAGPGRRRTMMDSAHDGQQERPAVEHAALV